MIKDQQLIMGMPITVKIIDSQASQTDLMNLFNYFREVDSRFSTFKSESEISKVNRGEIKADHYSNELRIILELAEITKSETTGYFDIGKVPNCDPSGIVKGWAIQEAANRLHRQGYTDFFVEAGGDIQTSGFDSDGQPWQVGIRNPFDRQTIVKQLVLTGQAIATSGNYEKGEHIYNPFNRQQKLSEVVSLTVISSKIIDADRFATAAFAMGRAGIDFIQDLTGFEGYQIDCDGIGTETTGFSQYLALHEPLKIRKLDYA